MIIRDFIAFLSFVYFIIDHQYSGSSARSKPRNNKDNIIYPSVILDAENPHNTGDFCSGLVRNLSWLLIVPAPL